MKFRVMSFNLQSGLGRDGVWDWSRSATEIARIAPDVAALQEVAVNRPQYPGIDYPALAAKQLDMHAVFDRALTFPNGGEYGVAVLSRFPLEKVARLALPLPPEAEPRIALVVKVLAPEPFHCICTHFPFQGEYADDDAGRTAAAAEIDAYAAAHRLAPCLLMGDLNSPPHAPALELLRRRWRVLNDLGSGVPTAETGKYGWMEIDYICAAPGIVCRKFVTDPALGASDHHAVYADVEIGAAR